jgi:fructokinase
MIHNMIFTVVPERVLVGGGIPTKRPFLLPMIRDRLAGQLGGYGGSDAIVARMSDFVTAPGLGDDAGPLGSLALALNALASIEWKD